MPSGRGELSLPSSLLLCLFDTFQKVPRTNHQKCKILEAVSKRRECAGQHIMQFWNREHSGSEDEVDFESDVERKRFSGGRCGTLCVRAREAWGWA